MVRVTGVPLNFLPMRGQQIKVVSMLYRRASPLANAQCSTDGRCHAAGGAGATVRSELDCSAFPRRCAGVRGQRLDPPSQG